MVTALFLSISTQTQNAGVDGYTQNELEQCYPFLPHRHVMDASGQVYDENGVLTKLTCGDYLRNASTTTGNMTGEFYGNLTNDTEISGMSGAREYYTVDEITQCYAALPQGDVVGPKGQIFDKNGVFTTFTCDDLLKDAPVATDWIGNATNMTSYMTGNMTDNITDSVPANEFQTFGNVNGGVGTADELAKLTEGGVLTDESQLQGLTDESQLRQSPPRTSENWLSTCKGLEWGLMRTCSAYVYPDGRLTIEGTRAKQCLTNGVLLSGAGILMSLPPSVIIGILEPASQMTGCGGLVKWETLKTAANPMDFLNLLK